MAFPFLAYICICNSWSVAESVDSVVVFLVAINPWTILGAESQPLYTYITTILVV